MDEDIRRLDLVAGLIDNDKKQYNSELLTPIIEGISYGLIESNSQIVKALNSTQDRFCLTDDKYNYYVYSLCEYLEAIQNELILEVNKKHTKKIYTVDNSSKGINYLLSIDRQYNNKLITPIILEIKNCTDLTRLEYINRELLNKLKSNNKELGHVMSTSDLRKLRNDIESYLDMHKNKLNKNKDNYKENIMFKKDKSQNFILHIDSKLIVDTNYYISIDDILKIVNRINKLSKNIKIHYKEFSITIVNCAEHIDIKVNNTLGDYNYISNLRVYNTGEIYKVSINKRSGKICKSEKYNQNSKEFYIIKFALDRLFDRYNEAKQRKLEKSNKNTEIKTHEIREIQNDVYINTTENNTNYENDAGVTDSKGGHHTSPRAHYRRGCIVHRKNGTTYTRKGGMVNKDKDGTNYKIK